MSGEDLERINDIIYATPQMRSYPIDASTVWDTLESIHGALYDKHALLGRCPSEECHTLKEQAWNLSLFEALFGPYDDLRGLSEEDRDLILETLSD